MYKMLFHFKVIDTLLLVFLVCSAIKNTSFIFKNEKILVEQILYI